MTTALLLTIVAVLALVVVSAFFSGSETALTALSRSRIFELERRGDERATRAARLIASRERLIGALLLGNNLVNILASALATGLFLELFGDYGVLYATVVMTVLILVFGEILPKTFAIARPEIAALNIARPVGVIVTLLGPITGAIQFLVRHGLKLFGADIDVKKAVLSPHDELRGAIDLHHLEGDMVKDDRDMLGGILDLRELEVSDVMVHRTNMYTIDAGEPADKIIAQALASAFTRIPLWRDDPDNIVGILHAKDLLRAVNQVKSKTEKLDIMGLCADPWFVPDTTPVPDQLSAFLKRKSHFAVVVDEYGEVMGLVTLEDILEEIVGDITDEHDTVQSGIEQLSSGAVKVEGSVPVRDLNRTMDWQLPDEEATTIAGLVIHEAQTIPDAGQAFTFYGFRFVVLKRQRNQLVALEVTPVKPA
jgi:Mg2+/Co2+ transporter CorB